MKTVIRSPASSCRSNLKTDPERSLQTQMFESPRLKRGDFFSGIDLSFAAALLCLRACASVATVSRPVHFLPDSQGQIKRETFDARRGLWSAA